MSERLDVIERAAQALREPVEIDAAAKQRLVAALRVEPRPRVSPARRTWRWLSTPRTLSISPVAGLAAAAAVALVAVLAGREDVARPETSLAASVPATGASGAAEMRPDSMVTFVFLAPGASSVSLVGDFNEWDAQATPLRRSLAGPGVWMVSLDLQPGRHVYSFVVDGRRWLADPGAPRAPEADFGAPSSVILVGGRAL